MPLRPSFSILLASASATLLATFVTHALVTNREMDRLHHSTAQLRQTIESGVDKYLTLLDGVRALAVARVSLNPVQFHDYVEALDLRENYRGIQSLGLALRIESTQKEEAIRKLAELGITNYRVWPDSSQTHLCPLMIIEPRDSTNQASLGFDLFAEPAWRGTANAAIESGEPRASAAALIRGTQGFSILVPVYRGGGLPKTIQDRRDNIAGFVHCAIQTDELIGAILGPGTNSGNSGLELAIFDGIETASSSPIYPSSISVRSMDSPQFRSAHILDVAGRPWTLRFSSPRAGSPAIPAFTFLGGSALTALLWRVAVFRSRARDMSERHNFELRELNASLEQRVVARTSELEAAVEDLRAFSYSVSHDLRAPLRHIDGYVNMLKQSPSVAADPIAQRNAAIVSQSARQMGQLIDALLNFSQLGRVRLAVTDSVDPSIVLRDVFQMLGPETEKREIKWIIGELPKVAADPTLLRQVFANLLSNALKYSRFSSPAVIEIGSADRGPETTFFVRDNGVGFDIKFADKLFSVFQRLHTSDDFEGIGIGLANVRKIIGRHGGRTWAEGALNQGATFYFTLPKNRPPDSASLRSRFEKEP